MPFNFPNSRISETWEVAAHNLAVGPSLLGTEQVVATLADKWTAILKLRLPQSGISALRAWKTSRRGRLVVDQIGPTRELAGSSDGRIFGATVLHSDGTAHDDGTGYAQGYSVAAAAALRATRMSITALGATDQFAVGRFFGIAARLYQITALGGSSATEVMVDFWPPLRAAVAAGDSFDWPPQTSMRLATDDSGAVGDNAASAIDVTLNLVEVL